LPVLEADLSARACWEGGSVAMGRADAFSDIDLYVVADTARHAPILDAFETALAHTAAIAHTWRVEPPAFAGVAQRIYLHDELPAELQDQLASFAYVAGPARIGEHLPAIDRLVASLFADLEATTE
jgi:hypothetical protein